MRIIGFALSFGVILCGIVGVAACLIFLRHGEWSWATFSLGQGALCAWQAGSMLWEACE